MDKQLLASESFRWNYWSFPKLPNGTAVAVWGCINNFISHFFGRMITYTCSIDRCLLMTVLSLPSALSLFWNKTGNLYTVRPKIYAHDLRFIIFLCVLLTQPLDKMAGIPQRIFSYVFSWMKSFIFWFKLHWSRFLRVQLTITEHWFR